MNDGTRLGLAAGTLLTWALATGCGAPVAVGYEPTTNPGDRDMVHRTTPRPVVAPGHRFVTHTETAQVRVPPAELLDWIVSVPLERILLGTEELAPVVRTDVLTEEWGTPGSRRRVVLGDGHTALEELVEYERGSRFEYVVWNFTNDAARATNYAHAQFRVEPTANGSRVTWTYRFQRKGCLTGIFLRRFVTRVYADYMGRCMREIIVQSERDLANPPPHEET